MRNTLQVVYGITAVLTLAAVVGAQLPTVTSGTLHTHVSAEAGVYAVSGGPAAVHNGPVGYWQDQSPNGNDAFNFDGDANRPILRINEVNNKPALRFRGTDYLDFGFMKNLTQPNTIFIVALTRDTNNQYIFDGVDSSNRQAFAVGASYVYKWFWYAGSSWYTTDRKSSTWFDHAVVYNGASSRHYIRGNLQGEGNPGTGNLGWGMRLGCRVAFSHFGNFDVAEIVIYEGALTESDIQAVSGYFVQKYAITGLPTEPTNQGPGTLVAQFDGSQVTTSGTDVVTWPNQVSSPDYPLDLQGVWVDMGDEPGYPQLAHYDFGGTAGVKNVIRFSLPETGSIAPYLQSAAIPTPTDEPTTVFVVARRDSHPLSSYLFDGIDADARRALMADGTPHTHAVLAGSRYGSGYTVDLGAWQVFSAVFNREFSQIFVDGFTEETYGLSGSHPFKGLTVGARYGGGNVMDGMIAEIKVYKGALDPQTRQSVETSLMEKYNIGPFCGAAYTTYHPMDFDKNCIVDVNDFAEFAKSWLNTTHPAGLLYADEE